MSITFTALSLLPKLAHKIPHKAPFQFKASQRSFKRQTLLEGHLKHIRDYFKNHRFKIRWEFNNKLEISDQSSSETACAGFTACL